MRRIDKALATLNLKRLSYFIALAEHGSISAAANALNMAQPSLSENISKLEEELDSKLAIRGARGIQMTEAGMALAKRGREILKSVDSMTEEIRQIGGDPRGSVSIGLPPSLSILLSVPLFETVYNEHPKSACISPRRCRATSSPGSTPTGSTLAAYTRLPTSRPIFSNQS
jgi:LysR family transcriptional regulator, nitrogen assimilation regulatory protein